MKCIFARPNEIEFRSSHIGDLAQLQSQSSSPSSSPSLSTAHRRVGTCRVDLKPKSCWRCCCCCCRSRSRCLCRCELALCELFGAQRVGAVVVVRVFVVAVAKTLNTGYVAAAVGAASIAGSASASAWCWSCALSLESVRVKQSSAYPANAVLF